MGRTNWTRVKHTAEAGVSKVKQHENFKWKQDSQSREVFMCHGRLENTSIFIYSDGWRVYKDGVYNVWEQAKKLFSTYLECLSQWNHPGLDEYTNECKRHLTGAAVSRHRWLSCTRDYRKYQNKKNQKIGLNRLWVKNPKPVLTDNQVVEMRRKKNSSGVMKNGKLSKSVCGKVREHRAFNRLL